MTISTNSTSAKLPGQLSYKQGSVRNLVVESLSTHGYAYINEADSTFDQESLVRTFGTPVRQYDRTEVWELRPEPDMDDVYHGRNTRALVPHTEAYEYENEPPRYLALWGVKPANGPGGETTIVDGWEFLATLTQDDIEYMRTVDQEWVTSEGLARQGVQWSRKAPMLTSSGTHEILRFTANNVKRGNGDRLESILDRGVEFFDENCSAVKIEKDALLIWDNWRMIHSRNSFSDRGRHLRRMLIEA